MMSTKASMNAANRAALAGSPRPGIAAPPREQCPTPYRFGPALIARPCDSVRIINPLLRPALRPVRIAAGTEEMRRHSKAATQPPFLFPVPADALSALESRRPGCL